MVLDGMQAENGLFFKKNFRGTKRRGFGFGFSSFLHNKVIRFERKFPFSKRKKYGLPLKFRSIDASGGRHFALDGVAARGARVVDCAACQSEPIPVS